MGMGQFLGKLGEKRAFRGRESYNAKNYNLSATVLSQTLWRGA